MSFKELIRKQDGLKCAGYSFATDGIFSEPFSQTNDYGNGADYVIIVPDHAVSQMQIVYSVYAAKTQTPLSPSDIQSIIADCGSLTLLERMSAKTASSGAPTAFMYEDMDYLSGKWADKAEFSYLYAMVICLFYLAFILEISAAAILATQVLSDWQEKQRQDRILRQLGMNEQLVYKLNNRQLLLLFLFPIFPSLLLSGCFISICAKKILVLFFELPPTPDFLLIGQSLGISLVLFALIYGVYFVAAQICYEHRRK